MVRHRKQLTGTIKRVYREDWNEYHVLDSFPEGGFPGTGSVGNLARDSTHNVLRFFDGSTWMLLSGHMSLANVFSKSLEEAFETSAQTETEALSLEYSRPYQNDKCLALVRFHGKLRNNSGNTGFVYAKVQILNPNGSQIFGKTYHTVSDQAHIYTFFDIVHLHEMGQAGDYVAKILIWSGNGDAVARLCTGEIKVWVLQ